MKKITATFVLFLTALFLTLTASAAESAIHSVAIDGNSVKVSVTAQADCHLFVALYDESGKMTAAKSESVSGAAEARTVALSFDSVPANAYARAFLLDKETFRPLCAPGDTRNSNAPVYTDDVWGILYADGALTIQHGDAPQPGREIIGAYPVPMAAEDAYVPGWNAVGKEIKLAEFADRIQPKSTANFFADCPNLTEIKNLGYLDTSATVNMFSMFRSCASLTALDVSGFDTANVSDMRAMFSGCKSLTALDLSKFNTSNVTNMGNMFRNCSALTALDLSSFDTAKVMNMDSMFNDCESLRTLNVSGFNTVNITNMSYMFHRCASLEALDLSGFDTANVTNMRQMFFGCEALKTLDIGAFNTANVTNMQSMFNGCAALETLGLSKFDTANVSDMRAMFSGCKSLTALDLSKFNTSNVSDMRAMFNGCKSLTALDLNGFQTANVTDMGYMFADCASLETLDVSSFDTMSAADIGGMFDGCANLIAVYASPQFVTNQVTDGTRVFGDCEALVGGAGTRYDKSHTDCAYARIDGGASNPGYFTAKT